MTGDIKDGGPAYPVPSYETEHGDDVTGFAEHPGMSLRDWFAGQALAGILGGNFADSIPHDDISGGKDAAVFAYQYADAMLAAREKRS